MAQLNTFGVLIFQSSIFFNILDLEDPFFNLGGDIGRCQRIKLS